VLIHQRRLATGRASGRIHGTIRLQQMGTGARIRTLQADRRYERMQIAGLHGVTEAQREAPLALGATE
jgi:hypothetical protein